MIVLKMINNDIYIYIYIYICIYIYIYMYKMIYIYIYKIIYIYIYVYVSHFFVFSNSAICNLCNFSVAYIPSCKSSSCCSYKFIWFSSDLNLVFPFYYLQPAIKVTNTICLVQHPLKAFV